VDRAESGRDSGVLDSERNRRFGNPDLRASQIEESKSEATIQTIHANLAGSANGDLPDRDLPVFADVGNGDRQAVGRDDVGAVEIVRAPKSPEAFSTKSAALESPKSSPAFSTKSAEAFSTKERPVFRIVSGEGFSTKNSPEIVSQLSLINSDIRTWRRLQNGKIYAPELHAVNPSGKRKIGRTLRTGYEILRRAFCRDCGGEKRLTAGYVSATQLIELERETYETKVGIIRNILRKKQRDIDGRLHDLRCAGCESGRSRGSLHIAEAS
jgi:hypothetical protein